jgi:hypothetical protein
MCAAGGGRVQVQAHHLRPFLLETLHQFGIAGLRAHPGQQLVARLMELLPLFLVVFDPE